MQDTFLNILKQGTPVPTVITIWTKGQVKVNILTALVLGLLNLAVPIVIHNLEDAECPPTTALLADMLALTVNKGLCFMEWLDKNQLG